MNPNQQHELSQRDPSTAIKAASADSERWADMFTTHILDYRNRFYTGRLPEFLVFSREDFESLWNLHPNEYHVIKIRGTEVRTPRYQQAYGVDYHYTGRTNKALPVPDLLAPLLNWAALYLYAGLNGILVNWYDGALAHYIGKHRDSTKNMIPGAPIVTVSFGEERVFRLRPWKGEGFRDFPTFHGSDFLMPYATNSAWTHEVPHSTKFRGKRISVTFRAFEDRERSSG